MNSLLLILGTLPAADPCPSCPVPQPGHTFPLADLSAQLHQPRRRTGTPQSDERVGVPVPRSRHSKNYRAFARSKCARARRARAGHIRPRFG